MVNPNLEIKCSLHTDTNIKSGTWYNNDIFIFNNAHHIKYLLPNGYVYALILSTTTYVLMCLLATLGCYCR